MKKLIVLAVSFLMLSAIAFGQCTDPETRAAKRMFNDASPDLKLATVLNHIASLRTVVTKEQRQALGELIPHLNAGVFAHKNTDPRKGEGIGHSSIWKRQDAAFQFERICANISGKGSYNDP